MVNSILQKANDLVNHDRAMTHGPFDANFKIASQIFNSWTGQNLTPANIAQVLIALKMARFKENPTHQDNLVDLAGYTELLHKLTTPQTKEDKKPLSMNIVSKG